MLRELRARGCHRIFVEGGGVTVSMFLEANLLDRLQIAIAPLLIGDGRPAIRLPPRTALSDCHRPRYRVFRMGADVLFDCEIGPDGNNATASPIRSRRSPGSSERSSAIPVDPSQIPRSSWPTTIWDRPAATCARRRSSPSRR